MISNKGLESEYKRLKAPPLAFVRIVDVYHSAVCWRQLLLRVCSWFEHCCFFVTNKHLVLGLFITGDAGGWPRLLMPGTARQTGAVFFL